MFKNLLKISVVALIAMMTIMVSCTKEEAETPEFVENFTDQAIFEMQARGNCGKFGCFEFVFPINIVFSDGSEAEVNSYEEMKEAISTWKTANPDVRERPTFTFPIEVISQDGEVISVTDQDELRDLKRSCRKDFFERHGHEGHRNRGTHCFSLVFPVTISFPDGTSSPAADRTEFKQSLRSWRADNRGSEERPTLVFPIQVEMAADETVVDVADKEALQELKESCSN